MDPNDSEWLNSGKGVPENAVRSNGNAAKSWQWRELGLEAPRSASNKTVLENIAEDRLVNKTPLNVKLCDLPGYPRSSFLMVFSPDGTTVASTHGNHNIYLTELSSGKHVQILRGHPRTPWCIAFHPSHPHLIGSGCLGGQVRVWDYASGGSELWTVANETVIASIAFHPSDQLLVVATYHELYFWDWSQRAPFIKVSTNNINEKIRYVAFDGLGHKLVTGISVWPSSGGGGNSLLQPSSRPPSDGNPGNDYSPPDPPPDAPTARPPDNSAQELFVSSYHSLVQRYDNLVRNYHRLFSARSQPPNMTDRGTDPMEVDWAQANSSRAAARASRTTHLPLPNMDDEPSDMSEPAPSVSGAFSAGGRNNSNENNTSSDQPERPRERSSQTVISPLAGLTSRVPRRSAFQLATNSRERSPASSSTRVLPNPFSSPSLSQDYRDTFRRSSGSRIRVFSREQNYTDELTNSLSEANLQHEHDSSSRTRAFSPDRIGSSLLSSVRASDGMDTDNLARRTLSFERLLQMRTLRDPEGLNPLVNEDTRRRALERLLELEQLRNDEIGIGASLSESPLRMPSWQPRNSSENLNNNDTSSEIPTRDESSTSRSDLSFQSFGMPELNTTQLSSEYIMQNILPSPHDPGNPSEPRSLSEYLSTTLQRQADNLYNVTSAENREQPHPSTSAGANVTPNSEMAPGSLSDQNQSSLSISQSLDIIRDILRDSGTRLLNLITDMSYSTLASVDGQAQNESPTPAHSEELYTVRSPTIEGNRRRNRNPISSSSDTESEQRALVVNIYRTINNAIHENHQSHNNNNESERPRPTDRMVVDLDLGNTEGPSEEGGSILHTLNNNRINITVSNNRFQLRTNSMENTNTESAERQSEDRQEAIPTNPLNQINPITSAPSNFSVDISAPITPTVPSASPMSTGAGPYNARDSLLLDSSTSVTSARSVSSSGPGQNEHLDFQMPSTSRDSEWPYRGMLPLGDPPMQNPLSAAEALRKVKLGIEALHRHTNTLTEMWLGGSRASMRELRLMWEDLRRQIIALHRQSRNENSSYFSRSFLERCQMISGRYFGISERDNSRRESSGSSTTERAVQVNVPTANNTPGPSRSQDPTVGSGSNPSEDQPSTSRSATAGLSGAQLRNNQSWTRNKRLAPTATRSAFKARSTPPTRRRMQSNARWRSGDDTRRRQRIVQRIEQYLLSARGSTRARQRENARSLELHFTRHEIRVRAMQVLSMMFSVMMSCLEEGELSSQIILMLRTLKKALGVTCLLLMTSNRRRDPVSLQNFRRRNSTTAAESAVTDGTSQPIPATQSVNRDNGQLPSNSEERQATRNSEERQASSNNEQRQPTSNSEERQPTSNSEERQATINSEERSRQPVTSATVTANSIENEFPELYVGTVQSENNNTTNSVPPGSSGSQMRTSAQTKKPNDDQQPSTSNRWSNRLAVQISAANLNETETARRRREVYLERKRLKALHRWNPIAHPLTKGKTMPLISHRIPTLRMAPSRMRASSTRRLNVTPGPSREATSESTEPQPSTSGDDDSSPMNRMRRRFRADLFRFAQIHAARLRNATRNRYRIRLYTPSSVREMFDILTTSPNERETESPPIPNNIQDQNRAPEPVRFSTYRPRLLTVHNNLESLNEAAEGSRQFGSLLNDRGELVPVVQVNNVPVNEAPEPPNPPRVNEYLQPIILAQNALVVEEAVGGGLLEAGLISESLVMPVHRIQAWDFTRGEAPNIKDSTKNIVVQRCKIHNDASIDISRDGRLLVALLPAHRLRNITYRVGISEAGVYSLEWRRLGECLHKVALDQTAVSVALSPTARHLAVGLGSRRVTTLPHNRNTFAQLFRLSDEGALKVRSLDHSWDQNFTSLNCLRWAPAPGQGLLYANNTGQLVIMN